MDVVSYAGDGFTAVVGTDTVLLVRAEADCELVGALWPLVAAGAAIAQLVGPLTAWGLPDFGLVRHRAGAITVLVRGCVTVTVDQHGGERTEVSAQTVSTWLENGFVEATRVTVVGEPTQRRPLPLAGGVVRAATIERIFDRSALAPVPQPPAEPSRPQPRSDSQTSSNSQPSRNSQTSSELRTPSTQQWAEPSTGGLGQSMAQHFGSGSAGLLPDTLPGWASEPVPPRQPDEPEATPQGEGDHDGETLPRLVPQPLDATEVVVRRMVRAIFCAHEQRHANPPTSPRCRLCQLELDPTQTPVVIDQPSLGTLRCLANGRLYPVRHAIIRIGREPRRVVGVDALLIRLTDVSPNISRDHLELKIDEWTVRATDLSTHGTKLIVAQQAPVYLEAGEPVRIMPGTTIELAGEVAFSYEVP